MTNPHTLAGFSIRLLSNIPADLKWRLGDLYGNKDVDALIATPDDELEGQIQRAFPNEAANWHLMAYTIKNVLPEKRMVLVNPLTGDVEVTGKPNKHGADASRLSFEQISGIEWAWRTAHPRLPEQLPSDPAEMARLQRKLFTPSSEECFSILMGYRSAISHGEVTPYTDTRELPRDNIHKLVERFNAPPQNEAEFRAAVIHDIREDKIAEGYEGRVAGVFRTLRVKGHNKRIDRAVVVKELIVTGYNVKGKVFLAPNCKLDDTSGNGYYDKVEMTWEEIYKLIKPEQ